MTEIETFDHIIKVASRLIAEKGFAKVSMNDIVEASGISKGGIYWHFKSKDDIIIAIVESIFQQQMAFLETVLAKNGRADEYLLQLMDMIIDSFVQFPSDIPSPLDIYSLAIRHPILKHQLAKFFKDYQNHFTTIIEQGVHEGIFDVDDIQQTAFIFMSMVEGIILVNSMTQDAEALSGALESATRLFIKGIRKPRGD